MSATHGIAGWGLAFAPMLPLIAIAAFAAVALLLLGFGAWRGARGLWWRAGGLALLILILLDPSLVRERRAPQKDVAIVVVDDSPSMEIGDRRAQASTAVAQLQDQLKSDPNLVLRVIHAGAPNPNEPLADPGTQLYHALTGALADLPRQRLAGAIMITDGEVHDMPPPNRLSLGAPLHVLLTGKPGEADRRLVVKNAPSFGLVGKPVTLTLKIEDLPEASGGGETAAAVTLRKDGGPPITQEVPVGVEIPVRLRIDHGGDNIFEISVAPGPHELTLDNNRAAFVIHGVRDRLKVLLVSGEPYQGERVWRNILKSDPSVDLVHFTILRPPEKQDGTPIRELSLIAFPIRELFDQKIGNFDLIIFDRYQQRSILPMSYLDNIVQRVREGGALLVEAGPSFGTPEGLYRSPLGSIMPAEPSGEVMEQGYRPRVSAVGRRHPVTADLPGLPADPSTPPSWGRWFRQVDASAHGGETVMTGVNGSPLLVLGRVGRGRVAELMSDEMWLWARGFEGGGPQAELLRRAVYWLMKEPDLEENDLRAAVEGNRLAVTRQSLAADKTPVRVTDPDGKITELTLAPEQGGRSRATMPLKRSGLYRVADGKRNAIAAAGALNPLELGDVRATGAKLAADVEATGGAMFWLGDGGMPEVQRVGPGRAAAGHGWLGLRENGDYVVTGVSELPLLPGLLALLLALGLFLAAWRQEGK
ncbi:MAG: hypothetical protein ACREFC_07030 [Stellaceae bacterium]